MSENITIPDDIKLSSLTKSEKIAVYEEKISDRKNIGNRKEILKEIGFSSEAEKQRIYSVVKNGTDDLIRCMDEDRISISRASVISKLPKSEQKKALYDYINGNAVSKGVSRKREEKNTIIKNMDKYGVYTKMKLYINDPKTTAANIAGCFGDSHRQVFVALLSELITQSHKKSLGNRDLYSVFDFEISSLSVGDIIEIHELKKTGMTTTDISMEFDVSNKTIQKALRKDISKYTKNA